MLWEKYMLFVKPSIISKKGQAEKGSDFCLNLTFLDFLGKKLR